MMGDSRKNVAYQTDQLARYFSQNRLAWEQFYESERVIIGGLGLDRRHRILDIGCGCGGLGLALRERFGVERYTGVEISPPAVEAGRALNPNARILSGDILDVTRDALRDERFDAVFSLSCVDWNIRFGDMLAAAWNHVLPGGYLVATFRLTAAEGCNDVSRSFQYVNYEGKLEGEHASYVVLNAQTLMQQLANFNPSDIVAYGYMGAPSATAVTPYASLCFAAVAIRKRAAADDGALRYRLDLPSAIRDMIDVHQR
jgi:SAM-dependent methyltransferase